MRTGCSYPRDVDTWVDRCERLLTQPELRRQMVKAARVDFLARLTAEHAAEKVAAHFERAVQLSRKAGSTT